MASQISLVEITAIKYEQGADVEFGYLENMVQLSSPDWRGSVDSLNNARSGYFDTVFTQECYCFQFYPIGQSNDRDYSGALDWTISEIGIEDVFGDWIDDFIQMFNEVISEYRAMGYPRLNSDIDSVENAVKFVTAWEYRGYRDYYGEYDDEWSLLGRVNMDKIKGILVKAT